MARNEKVEIEAPKHKHGVKIKSKPVTVTSGTCKAGHSVTCRPHKK